MTKKEMVARLKPWLESRPELNEMIQKDPGDIFRRLQDYMSRTRELKFEEQNPEQFEAFLTELKSFLVLGQAIKDAAPPKETEVDPILKRIDFVLRRIKKKEPPPSCE